MWDLKEFSERKRMSSGNEFHSTGPAQEMDRRPYRAIARHTQRYQGATWFVWRNERRYVCRPQTMKGAEHEYNYLVVDTSLHG